MYSLSVELFDFILICSIQTFTVVFLSVLIFGLKNNKYDCDESKNQQGFSMGAFGLKSFPVVVLSVAMSVVFVFLLLWIASLPITKEIGLLGILIFVAIQITTCFYVIKKGGLEWK